MFLSVWSGELKPGMAEEASSVFEKTVRPVVSNATGFIKTVFGLDRNTNKLVGIVLWNSAEDAAAVRDSTKFKAAFAQLLPQYKAPPTNENFEVIVDF